MLIDREKDYAEKDEATQAADSPAPTSTSAKELLCFAAVAALLFAGIYALFATGAWAYVFAIGLIVWLGYASTAHARVGSMRRDQARRYFR